VTHGRRSAAAKGITLLFRRAARRLRLLPLPGKRLHPAPNALTAYAKGESPRRAARWRAVPGVTGPAISTGEEHSVRATQQNRGSRWRMVLVVILASLWSLGLGNGSDQDGPKIPIPQRNFTVTVTDSKGQALEASRFTWEGKVHLRGQYGNATVTLPFQKLKKVNVLVEKKLKNPDLIGAAVELKTGESLELALERTSKCYGETRYGNYEIFLKDVAEIVFN
jgi:hypothetical protein